ncbi:MAG: M42 family metallopeptidase, partial [Candidatus Odinarchaeia archaeon]
IGMLVKFIDKNGFIRFSYTGGFFDQTVLNQRVAINTKKGLIHGVIGSKPPHLMLPEDKDKVVKRRSMFVDIGAKDREDALNMGVRVGDPITWVSKFTLLGDSRVTGKAFDDRAGCCALIQTLKELEVDADVYSVFAVMEEVGLRGAKTAAFALKPDAALIFETTAAGDFPGVKEEEATTKLGEGPVIIIADGSKTSLGGGLITHPLLRRILIETAEENNIPYQLEVFEGGTTDGTAISLSRSGVPTAVLSIPVRYIHTPTEVLDIRDLINTIKLAKLAIPKIIDEI